MQTPKQLRDQAFDEYLANHNSDHHTMRETWNDAVAWTLEHISEITGLMDEQALYIIETS